VQDSAAERDSGGRNVASMAEADGAVARATNRRATVARRAPYGSLDLRVVVERLAREDQRATGSAKPET